MDKIIIEGGRPISGSVKVSGSKNAALPILVSSLLTDGMSEYENVPQLRDIQSTIDLLMHLGARVSRREGRVCIDAQPPFPARNPGTQMRQQIRDALDITQRRFVLELAYTVRQ